MGYTIVIGALFAILVPTASFGHQSTNDKFHADEIRCMALNVYHEARGEPIQGQQAVAEVTLQRALSKGHSVCRTVYKPKAFSWTSHPVGRAYGPAWRTAVNVSKTVLLAEISGQEPLVRASHFHTKQVRPYWARHFTLVAVIGQHIFYQET